MTPRSLQGVLPFPQQASAKAPSMLVEGVEVHLAPIDWTKVRVEEVAAILAGLLVRDLHEDPPIEHKKASLQYDDRRTHTWSYEWSNENAGGVGAE